MSHPFSLVFDVNVHEGRFDDAKTAAQALVQDVQQNEPGTVFYRCFTDDEHRLCFLDTYASSEAFLTHITRPAVADALQGMLEIADVNAFTVCGDLSDEARKVVEEMGAQVLSQVAGFDRLSVIMA